MHPSSLAIESCVRGLREAFSSTTDRYRSHERSRQVLADFASAPDLLPRLLQHHLATPGSLNLTHFPMPGIEVVRDPAFTLAAHVWFGGLPQHAAGRSMTCVHHHGTLLLTTLAVRGPGCEVWSLSRPREGALDGRYALDCLSRTRNAVGTFAFTDAGYAHIVFPPEALSITLALWSRAAASPFLDALRQNVILRRNKALLLRAIRSIHLSKPLQVNEVVNFDFLPSPHGFQACQTRLQYERATNAYYLRNLFHLVHAARDPDCVAAVRRRLDTDGDGVTDSSLCRALLASLEQGNNMPVVVPEIHRFVPGLNITRPELLQALGRRDAPAFAA